jgi:integrase
MKKLVEGFLRSALFLIVVIAAYTGMRRNEILALRWSDFDMSEKTLRVRRALEQTKGNLGFKPPKTKRGIRDIDLEDRLVELLSAEQKRFLKIKAGIVDNSASVDLSLLKLSDEALIFPSFARPKSDLSQPRDPRAVTRAFTKLAGKLGFPDLRFHDLPWQPRHPASASRGPHRRCCAPPGTRPLHAVEVLREGDRHRQRPDHQGARGHGDAIERSQNDFGTTIGTKAVAAS